MPEQQPKTYSVSELAREFGISTRTIRYYEKVGLINSQRDKETQPHIYTDRDRTHLKLTLRGKRIGFSLAEIDEMIQELQEIKQEMLGFRERFMEFLSEKEGNKES